MIKRYRLIGDAGIMPETKVFGPGSIVDLDDTDPRVAIWLEDNVIAEVKPGPKAKAKEEGE